MKKKLNKIAKDTNVFLKTFFKKTKKNKTNCANEVRFVSWWKKN